MHANEIPHDNVVYGACTVREFNLIDYYNSPINNFNKIILFRLL